MHSMFAQSTDPPIVFARGLTIGEDMAPWVNDHIRQYWLSCGKALDEFNTRLVDDPRVDVLILPVFDGVTQVRWRNPNSRDMPN